MIILIGKCSLLIVDLVTQFKQSIAMHFHWIFSVFFVDSFPFFSSLCLHKSKLFFYKSFVFFLFLAKQIFIFISYEKYQLQSVNFFVLSNIVLFHNERVQFCLSLHELEN